MNIPQPVQTAMQQTNELFSTAMREQRFELLGEVYTKDARVLPPSAPMVEGRAAI